VPPHITITITIFLSIISTAILSYVSLAVTVGPWIDTTVVLLAAFLLHFFGRSFTPFTRQQSTACITIGASIGGILATACAFAFPTLHFLDNELFTEWLASPSYFIIVLFFLSFLSGTFGFLLANLFERTLIIEKQLAFPIGQLTFKMISVQKTFQKAKELLVGFTTTIIYCLAQFFSFLPKTLTLIPEISNKFIMVPSIQVNIFVLPMLWAIGFISGTMTTIPLIIGILSKVLISDITHKTFFTHLSYNDFIFAFATGIITYETSQSFLRLPSFFKTFYSFIQKEFRVMNLKTSLLIIYRQLFIWLFFLFSITIFLYYFNFTFISQLYLLIFV
jgi:uncharacterized oligopeptide transporter (OPT) family protein